MFSNKEPIKTEYMSARELLKAELVKKLQEHTKEELIERYMDDNCDGLYEYLIESIDIKE